MTHIQWTKSITIEPEHILLNHKLSYNIGNGLYHKAIQVKNRIKKIQKSPSQTILSMFARKCHRCGYVGYLKLHYC